MNLAGLQKLTLLDYPEKTACTVFFGGCNFRCPFCHNGPLVLTPKEVPPISEEEFFSFLKKRQGLLDGVCITGGEPLLQPELESFCRKIKEAGFSVKLDTNGSKPLLLKDLIEKELVDYVAMDVKNCPERYGETVGIKDFDLEPVSQSIALLMNGSTPFEFRTTISHPFHDEASMENLAKWIAGAPRYFLQLYQDSPGVIGSGLSAPSEEEAKAFLNIVRPFVPSAQIRGI